MGRRRDGHRADNVLVSHFGELVVVVKARDADLLARVEMRLRQGEGDPIHRAQLAEYRLVLDSPLAVDGLPFLAGELVDAGGHAVVLAGAHEVLGKVAARDIPVRTQLVETVDIAGRGHIGLRLDGEVRMPQLVGPFVVRARQNEGGGVARDRAGSASARASDGGDRRLGRQWRRRDAGTPGDRRQAVLHRIAHVRDGRRLKRGLHARGNHTGRFIAHERRQQRGRGLRGIVVILAQTVRPSDVDRACTRVTDALLENRPRRGRRDMEVHATDRADDGTCQSGGSRRIGTRPQTICECVSFGAPRGSPGLPSSRHGRDMRIDARDPLHRQVIRAPLLGRVRKIHAAVAQIIAIRWVHREVWLIGAIKVL